MQTSFGLSGGEAEKILDGVGITLNKNMIADDERPAADPSGVRLGTPAMTTRGFREGESARVAELLCDALTHRADPEKLPVIEQELRALCARHPIPAAFI